MNPETLFPIGVLGAVFIALCGAIWKLLHAKINSDNKAMHELMLTNNKTVTEAIAKLDASLSANLRDSNTQLSQRLTNGSLRMDDMQKEIAGTKVKLAEDYHTVNETRMLINDIVQPMKDLYINLSKQLDRLEHIMIGKIKGDP